MNIRKLVRVAAMSIITVGVLSACNGGLSTPSNDLPSEPKKIVKKYIDPAHYKTVRECVSRQNGKCKKYTNKKKMTDDKDWLLVTSDGTTYDVTEDVYNSVQVDQWWNNWQSYGG